MIKSPLLRTYWIQSSEISHGLGVTAFSEDDAFRLLREAGYGLSPSDPAIHVIEGIQVSELDQNHVVPNMGPVVFRSIWYPRLNL